MPARDVENLMFLEVARDVYSLIDAGEPMPECFPAALLASTNEVWLACYLLEKAEKHCESPIEVQLLRAMFTAWYGYDSGRVLILLANKGSAVLVNRDSDDTHEEIPRLKISIQHQVDQYTADFAICVELVGKKLAEIVVECDGHAFHERTKEQAAHDRARDRHMTAKGIRVMRFTGSQIYQNAKACVEELDGLVSRLMCDANK